MYYIVFSRSRATAQDAYRFVYGAVGYMLRSGVFAKGVGRGLVKGIRLHVRQFDRRNNKNISSRGAEVNFVSLNPQEDLKVPMWATSMIAPALALQ